MLFQKVILVFVHHFLSTFSFKIELPPTEALTYQIVTWIIFSIVLLTRIYNYILQNNNISVL